MSIRTLLVIALATAPLAGCDGLGAGPCVHVFEDPVIRIADVQSAAGDAIDRVEFSEFRVRGTSVDADALADDPAYGVQVTSEGTLLCDVPCGFAVDEGAYEFRVEADGYQSRALDVEARFQDFSGGCPSSNSGSTEISVQLLDLIE